MKKVLLAFLFCMLLVIGSSVALAEQIFAFESLDYDVLQGKVLKLTPIAQGIEQKMTYTWHSLDETIATVSPKGAVKAINSGTTQISCVATTKDGTEYTATCNVRVCIPVTKIVVEENNITLRQDKDYQLHWTIEPANATIQEIEWTAQKGVVSVNNNGVVRNFYGLGQDTIIGTAKDGSGTKVRIAVNIPMVYVTESKITVTEESGANFYYELASVSGISSWSYGASGNCFTLESIPEQDDMHGYHIVPVKAGTGKVNFKRNGRSVGSVTVVIKDSAVRSTKTYPPLNVTDALANQDAYIGKKVSLDIIRESDDNLPESKRNQGTVFASVKSKKTADSKQYVVLESAAMLKKLDVGKSIKVYGILHHFETITTPTGLQYEVPVLSDVTYQK